MTDFGHGILLIDKPQNKSSFYLVHVLRKITGVKKIGHCGTLDPFATGVMVMLIGKAYTTRSMELTADDKEYEATVCLGKGTTSYDIDGEVNLVSDICPSLLQIQEAILDFQGLCQQTPPMFSAKKVAGKRLYELARDGIEIERKSSEVIMHTEILSYEYPYLKIYVRCSKGTYIRSIAHDLGLKLGCYAHLSSLRRTRSGAYSIDKAINLDELNAFNYRNFLMK
jgi:tRNA pseudouridine55 synthase